jgi:hypothetical protein
MDCVSNGLGRSWFPVTSYRWKCLACCAHQRLLFQHIHKFLMCKDVRPRKRSLFHYPSPPCHSCLPISVSGALGEISKPATSACKTRIVTILEAGRNQLNTSTDQPYVANSILNCEMEIHHLCPGQGWMNGWVRTESVNMHLPSVVAQSF